MSLSSAFPSSFPSSLFSLHLYHKYPLLLIAILVLFCHSELLPPKILFRSQLHNPSLFFVTSNENNISQQKRMGNHVASALAQSANTKPVNQLVTEFLQAEKFVVIGASNRRHKFGNKLVRCYQQNKLKVFPVNPIAKDIEGLPVWRSLSDIPGIQEEDVAVSIVTPAEVTKTAIEEASTLGISKIWLQPGAESPTVLEKAKELDLQLIFGGPCVLIELGFRDE
mmetsp:Transcript_816/g.1157  ORF Transcript_816/g.1157 Transcript_816/m.1157 type:complete len:224 (-) Transcript_816:372-1043(-)